MKKAYYDGSSKVIHHKEMRDPIEGDTIQPLNSNRYCRRPLLHMLVLPICILRLPSRLRCSGHSHVDYSRLVPKVTGFWIDQLLSLFDLNCATIFCIRYFGINLKLHELIRFDSIAPYTGLNSLQKVEFHSESISLESDSGSLLLTELGLS